jgi:hypothetical protein
MTCILSTKINKKQEHTKKSKKTFGGNEYVYYLYYEDDIIVCTYVQTHQIVYLKHVWEVFYFVYQLYLNTTINTSPSNFIISFILFSVSYLETDSLSAYLLSHLLGFFPDLFLTFTLEIS